MPGAACYEIPIYEPGWLAKWIGPWVFAEEPTPNATICERTARQ